MFKKMKIVNMKKFIKSISIVALIIIGIIFLSTKVTLSHTEKAQKAYDTINIIQGDTLWNIAIEQKKENPYYENKDVRYIVNEIQKINKLENANLQIGQTLQVPII